MRTGGRFRYAYVLREGFSARYSAVTVSSVFARREPSKLREFADDIRDGKFVLPISRRMPLDEARVAYEMLEKGGGGRTHSVRRWCRCARRADAHRVCWSR